MNTEKIFTDGMIAKKPSPKAPDYIIAELSIKSRDFYEFMKKHTKDGWLNITVKEARNGKFYSELNTFTPNSKKRPESNPQQDQSNSQGYLKANDGFSDDIPF